MSFWTEETIDRMLKMREEGFSCGQIGGVLGCTRSAVIGRLHRMGLSNARRLPQKTGVAKPTSNIRNQKRTSQNLVKQMRQLAAKMRAVEETPAALLPIVPPSATGVAGVSLLELMDLEPHHCRFPLTDGAPFYFCGAQRTDGSSYCIKHDQICRVKPIRTKQPFAFRRLAA